MSEEKTRRILARIKELTKKVQNVKNNGNNNLNTELLEKVCKTLEKVILYLKNN